MIISLFSLLLGLGLGRLPRLALLSLPPHDIIQSWIRFMVHAQKARGEGEVIFLQYIGDKIQVFITMLYSCII